MPRDCPLTVPGRAEQPERAEQAAVASEVARLSFCAVCGSLVMPACHCDKCGCLVRLKPRSRKPAVYTAQ